MTLMLYRIDDRLIHGQVVVGWGQPLDIDFIVLDRRSAASFIAFDERTYAAAALSDHCAVTTRLSLQ